MGREVKILSCQSSCFQLQSNKAMLCLALTFKMKTYAVLIYLVPKFPDFLCFPLVMLLLKMDPKLLKCYLEDFLLDKLYLGIRRIVTAYELEESAICVKLSLNRNASKTKLYID